MGHLSVMRLGFCFAFVLMWCPLINLVADIPWLMYTTVSVILVCRSMLACLCFTPAMILVANAIEADKRGALNG